VKAGYLIKEFNLINENLFCIYFKVLTSVETLLFKYGSGVGTNWSKIRAKNEILSGGVDVLPTHKCGGFWDQAILADGRRSYSI
jgi:hypothetical protein